MRRPVESRAGSTRAGDLSREQVESALDNLLSDNEEVSSTQPAGPKEDRRAVSLRPEPILKTTSSRWDQSPSGRLSPHGRQSTGRSTGSQRSMAVNLTEGYAPPARQRRRSSVRSPKAYGLGVSQGFDVTTLAELHIFLDEKQREIVRAHARRTKELEDVLTREERNFEDLLGAEMEKVGVQLKITSDLLKGQKSSSNNLFRRGSRRLSTEGVDDNIQARHSESVKKSEHLRKKLKAHHDDARTALSKKLQVESARMGRVIKTNLGKYSNPNLAQGSKVAVLASIVEYLNGEEFVRIVTAPLKYTSPAFVASTEEELRAEIKFVPTPMASSGLEMSEYNYELAGPQEQRIQERQDTTTNYARPREKTVQNLTSDREARAAQMRDEEEEPRRPEVRTSRQEEEKVDKHQEQLQQQAEMKRASDEEDLRRRRADMAREHEAFLESQAEFKRFKDKEMERWRVEMQQKLDEEMDRQEKEIRERAEEAARHKAELARDTEAGIQAEVDMIKSGVGNLHSKQSSVADEETTWGGDEAARPTQEGDRRHAAEEETKPRIGCDLLRRGTADIAIEEGRVAAETAALEAKVREFERHQKEADAQTDSRGKAEREAFSIARGQRAPEVIALEQFKPDEEADGRAGSRRGDDAEDGLGEGPQIERFCLGDNVDAYCTPVGALAGAKAFIRGEVAHVNPDKSLDVILSDGRMRQEVPLSQIRFVHRRVTASQGGLSSDEDKGPSPPHEGSLVPAGHAVGQHDSTLPTKGGLDNHTIVAKSSAGVAVEHVLGHDGTMTPVNDVPSTSTTPRGQDRNAAAEKSTGGMKVVKRASLDDILATKRRSIVKGSKKEILREGDAVEVLDAGRQKNQAEFIRGVVSCVNEDGSVDVALDGKGLMLRVPDGEVRLVRQSPPTTLAVGDRVEAKYAGDSNFHRGIVTSTEDGVSINFDDGWHGASIPVSNVRRVGEKRSERGVDSATPKLSSAERMRSTACIVDLDVGSLGGNSSSVGDQVQVREKRTRGEGLLKTLNGVVRAVRPIGTYLVGFPDGTTRDHVPEACITDFEWTSNGSAAYRRALHPEKRTEMAGEHPKKEPDKIRSHADLSGGEEGTGKRKMSFSESLRHALSSKFGASRILPEGTIGRNSGGDERAHGDPERQRRSTHAGVIDSGETRLAHNLLHFRPQAFMDPDTAAQAILTPNNAGMFRTATRRPRERAEVWSELSYNTETEDSDGENGGVAQEGTKRGLSRDSMDGYPLTDAPKRRMTFGGLRSDRKGTVYTAQRRPNFVATLRQRVKKVAEVATGAARRLSIQGNNGQGFELVAIGDRKKSANLNTRRASAAGSDGEDSEDDDLEHETHFHNRRRHIFEPQHTESAPSAWWIRVCGTINMICMAVYLWWRIKRSLIGVLHVIWGYIFLGAECIMAIGMIVGHSSRSFPVHREKVYMDDLTDLDPGVGRLKVAVLVPTCGEKTSVMLMALFGNLQLRLWKSINTRRDTLRIVVLDEKRREEVQKLVSLVYTLAEVVLDKTVREILMREGVAPVSAKGFYDHFANGEHGQRVYDDINFIRGVEIVSEIDKLIAANDDNINRFSPSLAISRIKERARRASCFERKEIQPGQKKVWNRNKYIPTIVYYSRIDAGQPRISPKAGNMNRAIFSFNPQEEPLIGEAAVVVVNDVRHELYPEFLQRTVPYFFTFDRIRRCYKWADIAFIQTPQRFHDHHEWHDPDPLGNQAATQFDIVNSGRDGAGGALSCGQGSLWRVQVLRDGIRPDGSKYVKKGIPLEDQVGRQAGVGFRSEVLIEDTHTSIDLFRQGWKSVYVNFPKEILARCTFPPDTVKWRWKQVLRWHQGAVQLAMWKGWKYAVTGENWGTFFQRVFAFDAISYFLQAFAGEVLLIFPIVYGFTNSAPFNTWNIEFALYFFPFIITGVLPTVAALGWQKTSSERVMRDEQIWFATSFVQIYAVMHAVWGTITRKDPSNAWECKCPVWPLYAHFVAVIVATVFNTADWVARGFEQPWVWVSCVGSSLFALHSLWPVVSFGLGVTMPPAFYTRVFGMLVVMTLVSLWLLGESS